MNWPLEFKKIFPGRLWRHKVLTRHALWVCSFREWQCVTRREVFKVRGCHETALPFTAPLLSFFSSPHLFLSKQWFYRWHRNLREYKCGSSEQFRKISVRYSPFKRSAYDWVILIVPIHNDRIYIMHWDDLTRIFYTCYVLWFSLTWIKLILQQHIFSVFKHVDSLLLI